MNMKSSSITDTITTSGSDGVGNGEDLNGGSHQRGSSDLTTRTSTTNDTADDIVSINKNTSLSSVAPQQEDRYNKAAAVKQKMDTDGSLLLLEEAERYAVERIPVTMIFPVKLHAMLEDADKLGFNDIISWQGGGHSFKIHDPERFTNETMQKYFDQCTKFKSFHRQLNFYGFKRIPLGPYKGGYTHPMFCRSDPQRCENMQRYTSRKGGKNKGEENSRQRGKVVPEDNINKHRIKKKSRTSDEDITSAPTSTDCAARSGGASDTDTKYCFFELDGSYGSAFPFERTSALVTPSTSVSSSLGERSTIQQSPRKRVFEMHVRHVSEDQQSSQVLSTPSSSVAVSYSSEQQNVVSPYLHRDTTQIVMGTRSGDASRKRRLVLQEAASQQRQHDEDEVLLQFDEAEMDFLDNVMMIHQDSSNKKNIKKDGSFAVIIRDDHGEEKKAQQSEEDAHKIPNHDHGNGNQNQMSDCPSTVSSLHPKIVDTSSESSRSEDSTRTSVARTRIAVEAGAAANDGNVLESSLMSTDAALESDSFFQELVEDYLQLLDDDFNGYPRKKTVAVSSPSSKPNNCEITETKKSNRTFDSGDNNNKNTTDASQNLEREMFEKTSCLLLSDDEEQRMIFDLCNPPKEEIEPVRLEAGKIPHVSSQEEKYVGRQNGNDERTATSTKETNEDHFSYFSHEERTDQVNFVSQNGGNSSTYQDMNGHYIFDDAGKLLRPPRQLALTAPTIRPPVATNFRNRDPQPKHCREVSWASTSSSPYTTVHHRHGQQHEDKYWWAKPYHLPEERRMQLRVGETSCWHHNPGHQNWHIQDRYRNRHDYDDSFENSNHYHDASSRHHQEYPLEKSNHQNFPMEGILPNVPSDGELNKQNKESQQQQISRVDQLDHLILGQSVENKEDQEHLLERSSFPFRLHTLLTDSERGVSGEVKKTKESSSSFEDIISWVENGTAFKVHNRKAFVKDIMPNYFDQTKFESFRRQLNMYGFHRVSTGDRRGVISHPNFVKGNRSLCRLITRNVPPPTTGSRRSVNS